MSTQQNPWKRNRVTFNPYHRTAFRIARVPRNITRRKTVSILVTQTRQVVNTDANAHQVEAEPVDAAELNWAEKVLLDPQSRILEELIQHPPEKPPLDHLKFLSEELRSSFDTDQERTHPNLNMAALTKWVPELIEQILEELGRPDPMVGAQELTVLPPFGKFEQKENEGG